jgi:hypothetical protein
MALASDPSFTLPAEPSRWQQELPPGAWREVLLHLAPEQRFVAAMVCQAWRSHALSLLTPDLEVCLNSGACNVQQQGMQGTACSAPSVHGHRPVHRQHQATSSMLSAPTQRSLPPAGAAAAGFSHWLHAHGQQLHSLTITEYYFSHHGHHGPQGPAQGGVLRSRLGQIARVQLWQGLHSFGKPLRQLHTLKVGMWCLLAPVDFALNACYSGQSTANHLPTAGQPSKYTILMTHNSTLGLLLSSADRLRTAGQPSKYTILVTHNSTLDLLLSSADRPPVHRSNWMT